MIREAIDTIASGRSLSMEDASTVMSEIMEGEATHGQMGALFTALHIKGETVDEIAGMATTMREKALTVISVCRLLVPGQLGCVKDAGCILERNTLCLAHRFWDVRMGHSSCDDRDSTLIEWFAQVMER